MARRTHYLQEERMVVVDGRKISLTEREGDALHYLLLHAGEVVSRADLERQVWGMRPGVRSQTVPVTVRRLRLKLGDDELIETVWGVGWRFAETEKVDAPLPERPSFTTPFLERPELSRLHDFRKESRVVTVVGPGGSGKTRLVGQLIDTTKLPHLWVQVLHNDTAEVLLRRIATAGSLESSGSEALDSALRDGTTIILDDAESAPNAAADVVRSLKSPAFVITSRHPLDVDEQAVVPLEGLSGEAARRFLKSHLRRARWGRSYPAPLLDRVARAVDGLPLALEFATSQPEPLDTWVERVEVEVMPGPEGERLTTNIERSLVPLDAHQIEILAALSIAGAPTSETDLRDWLGPDAIDRARELGRRSLLTWSSGWQVLATVATVVRARELDWSRLRSRRDDWLLGWITAQDFGTDPIGTADRIGPVTDELFDMLGRISAEDAMDVVWTLCELFAIRGPVSGIQDAVHHGLRAHSDHPLLLAMATLGDVRPDGRRFLDVERTPRYAARALWVHASIQPKTVPLQWLTQTLERCEDAHLSLQLERMRFRVRASQGLHVGRSELEDLERRTRNHPAVHGRTTSQLATMLASDGEPQRALTLMKIEFPSGIVVLDAQLAATAAFIQCALDPQAGIADLLAAAELARSNGQPIWARDLTCQAAVFRYVLGEPVLAELEAASGSLYNAIAEAIVRFEHDGVVELELVPAAFAIVLQALWDDDLERGIEQLSQLPNTRDRQVLSRILQMSKV